MITAAEEPPSRVRTQRIMCHEYRSQKPLPGLKRGSRLPKSKSTTLSTPALNYRTAISYRTKSSANVKVKRHKNQQCYYSLC